MNNEPNTPVPAEQFKQPDRSGIILALGILSLLIGCAGWILGIIAWTMANRDLAFMDRGMMQSTGRGTTQAGKICGIVSVCLHAIGFVLGLLWLVFVVGLVGVAATAGAAAAAKSQQQSTSAQQTAEEKRISDIAVREFMKGRTGECEASQPSWDGKAWTVFVSGKPAAPGDHCFYTISAEGKILKTFFGR